MTDLVFVDTNVLVYARDAGEPDKQPRAEEWLAHLWRSAAGRVSAQVLREFYVTVTAKLDAAVPRSEARKDVRDLLAWRHDIEEAHLVEDAWRIEDRHKIHWWDALIVAAAHLAPGKTTDRFLDRTITIPKNRMTLGELEGDPDGFAPPWRPFSLSITVPQDESAKTIAFPATTLTLRDFVHAVESQSTLRHRFAHC